MTIKIIDAERLILSNQHQILSYLGTENSAWHLRVAYFGYDPDAKADLAVQCIANFANDNSVTAGFHPELLNFLSSVARVEPVVVWPAIMHRLETHRKEKGTWHLLNWL